jgi:PAS domain S-box-containing protein
MKSNLVQKSGQRSGGASLYVTRHLGTSPGSLFSRVSISQRLAVIVLALALPFNVVVLAAVWRLSEAESEAQRVSLLYTARTVAAAVDAKIGQYMAFGEALSRFPSLLDENLALFEIEARRAFASLPDASILVADLNGQELMNTAVEAGQLLPVRSTAGFKAQRQALDRGAPVISGVRKEIVSHTWGLTVEIPILKNGLPFRALAVAVKAEAFFRLLNEQHLPQDWFAGMIDAEGRYIARAVPGDSGESVGQLASESWRRIQDRDGVHEILTLEGEPVVKANARSRATGWSLGVAVRKSILQAAAWRTARWALIAGGGLSILSLVFASAVARSIVSPIRELRSKAQALFSGSGSMPLPAGPPEVDDLWRALKRSSVDRDRSEKALRESESRFRGVFEHAATGIAIMDLKGCFQSCNPAYSRMLGYSEEELRALICANLIHSEDRAANKAELDKLLAGKISSYELVSRYSNRDGQVLWGHRYVSLLRDAADRPSHIVALVTNITERKRHEEQIDLLVSEVNHRAKNMLSVVQAIARQTVAASPGDFIAQFGERIQALAASQDLLVKNNWKGVGLNELVRSQLGHFKGMIGTRIELYGPPFLISAAAAQPMGMALHELATNAGKYGSLSNDRGRVELQWSVGAAEDGEEIFVIGWRERDGPVVTAPSRSGFGSIVLWRVVKESLDAEVELGFAPDGLTWRLRCAARAIEDGSRSAHVTHLPS